MTIAEWTPLDREQAEALFEEHAVLMGKADAIPMHIAAQIFPPEVVQYVRRGSFAGDYWNGGGLNELFPNVFYCFLTRSGFMAAVGLSNARKFCDEHPDIYPPETKTNKSKKEDATC